MTVGVESCSPDGSDEMIRISGGRFWMGSNAHYPEEAPIRLVAVNDFYMDRAPVTNAEFAAFVADTGYVTTAETAPALEDYPDADPTMLRAGSSLFVPPAHPVPLDDPFRWWEYVFGTNWRHPWGPDSTIEDLGDHPVTHVSYFDAQAYAGWAGKRLPTEAEWEFAARGGRDREIFAWGSVLEPDGRHMANVWQGPFPWKNVLGDGFLRTSPVGSFPPNDYGLFDMIGNVWEWTSDWYSTPSLSPGKQPCCAISAPLGGTEQGSRDPNTPLIKFGRKVLKGGSHLCAPGYCERYRPAARYPQTVDTSTSHIGFRCAQSSTPE